MSRDYAPSFFDEKRPWSRYKDMVLDYYLKPYLTKVSRIGKPICVVDMFAGRGRFRSGEVGSPLIIASQLDRIRRSGVEVELSCFETIPAHAEVLKHELGIYDFASVQESDCYSHIDSIAEKANHNTTLLYIDPCKACELRLSDLVKVYKKIHQNSSVEVLLVFMAKAFVRQATALLVRERRLERLAMDDPHIREMPEDEWGDWICALYGPEETSELARVERARAELTAVVGGDYWIDIVSNKAITFLEKCDQLVRAYLDRMSEWFAVRLAFPIQADTGSPTPKYWLVFGSRYLPAIDLVNRAACCARREQGIAWRDEDSLFATMVIDTAARPESVDFALRKLAKESGQMCWKELRWKLSELQLGRFTDSEINNSIKRLLNRGELSGASGSRVEEDLVLTPRMT